MIKKMLVFIIVTAILMGCGSRVNLRDEVVGKTYILEERVNLEGDYEVYATLNFEQGRLSGKFLNSYNSSYKIEGNTITVSPMATTLMAGPEELMEKETEYFSELTNANKISLEGEVLTITTVQGKELIFQEAE